MYRAFAYPGGPQCNHYFCRSTIPNLPASYEFCAGIVGVENAIPPGAGPGPSGRLQKRSALQNNIKTTILAIVILSPERLWLYLQAFLSRKQKQKASTVLTWSRK